MLPPAYYKKKSKFDKSNYTPANVLKILSKVFKNVLYHQISKHVKNISSKYLTSLGKGLNSQNRLLIMI